ncbi:glycosyltransferase family 2 protein [Jeotgalibaca caeni]|uniref:glycosyltransferase family 2 protein n=1 Tax=Jeotgalibaca caeni TaxID=3028623 RepID=UPI00237D7CE1|nr:glycosyltransferase [Jeotgalibaca caeni]MDE1549293.1 glycosyltransferase [Jeotgalibaca caeni]
MLTEFVIPLLRISSYFFIGYVIVYTTFLFISVIFSFLELTRKYKMKGFGIQLKHAFYYPVSIVVAAYNEEVTILSTINSLVKLDYRLYEVVVVDDGSKDATAAKMIETYQLKKVSKPVQIKINTQKMFEIYEGQVENVKVTLVRKENGGKGDALNAGINVASFPYFVTIDADSMLQKDALEKAMQPVLRDETTIAVGGLIRISQTARFKDGKAISYELPWNPVISMQAVEYERSFLASRVFMNQFNNNLIISGAFGLFKKSAVIAVGGYNPKTLGEDMDLVMRMIMHFTKNKSPFRIEYEPSAVCWSQAPHQFSDLRKQRKRWYLGLFQSLKEYRLMGSGFKRGFRFLWSYYYYFFFELLAPFIELVGIFTILLSLYLDLLFVPYVVWLFLLYLLFNFTVTLTSFVLRIYIQDSKDRMQNIWRAIVMILLETFFYRYALSYIRVTAFIGYRRNKHSWGKITRTEQTIEEEK